MQTEAAAILNYLGPIATGAPVDAPIVRQIPPAWLHLYWPRILPDVEAVIARNADRWSVQTIAEKLITGEWQTWIVWNGTIQAIVATELFHEPTGLKAARAVFVSGRDMKTWTHLISDLEDWARDQGCARFDMIIAKGLARQFPEYRLTHVLLEKDLTHGL